MSIARSDRPVRRSPLESSHAALGARWVDAVSIWPADYGDPARESESARSAAGLAEVAGIEKLILRGQGVRAALARAGLPFRPGEATPAHGVPTREGVQIWGLAPDEALLLRLEVTGPLEVEGPGMAVVDVSAGLVELRLAGPNSGRILAELCALDLDPSVFANHRVAQASMANVRVALARVDLAGRPAYDILVARDYAVYLWDSLIHAGRGHGLVPVGPAAFGPAVLEAGANQ